MPNGDNQDDNMGQIVPFLLVGALGIGAFFLLSGGRRQQVAPSQQSATIEDVEFSRV